MRNLLLLFVFISCNLHTQPGMIKEFNTAKSDQQFYQDFLNFFSDEPGKTRVDIFIQVPYSHIQFVKTDDGFSGSYSVTVSVFDEEKERLIVEKSWVEKITAKEFEQTTSKNNFNLSLRSVILEPGKYLVRSEMQDLDSKKSVVKEELFMVKRMDSQLALSDIMLIAKQTLVNGNNKIVPNVSKNVALQKEEQGLQFFFEAHSGEPKNVSIEYSLIEAGKDVISRDTVDKRLDSGNTQIFHTINNVQLGMGDYLIKADIIDNSGNLVASTEKSFFSRWIGMPSTINDINKAVDEMIYIASGGEVDDIKESKTQEEKLQHFLEFWKKKDPTPQTEDNPVFEEYYRRVEYANQNFSHYIEGWRTDRGMVFIILGSPNNVDRHPFEYDSKPYEVWEYYELNKYFVFVDETGFGDYRLSTPLYGDFYRYR